MSYQTGFLTQVLRDEKKVPEAWNGPILAIPCITYTISCVLVNYITRIPRRLLILLSFLLLALSMSLQGPSEVFHIPDLIPIVLAGFSVNGIAQGFIFIPLLPDALEAVFLEEGIIEGENEQLDMLIADYGSGLYGTFFSIGQILAPIVGSAIKFAIGYRATTDLMMFVCLGWATIFFIFNVGFNIYQKERDIHAKIEKAKIATVKTEGFDEGEKPESMTDFLNRKREQWRQSGEIESVGKNKYGVNELYSIMESKNEGGTFITSEMTKS
jgi:hypothetical protein